jgi:hypothetical protein
MDKEWLTIKSRINWLKELSKEQNLKPDNSPGIEINAKIKWLANQLRRLKYKKVHKISG